MRRALTILLVALGGFLTAFIGGSAVAGALELPGTGHLDGLTSSVDQSQTGTVDNSTDQTSKAKVDNQQSNVYVPISILSPSSGDNHVEQGNQASNQAGSATVNGTDQQAHQGQTGTATTTDDSRDSGWNDGGSGNQAAVDQSQTGTVGNTTTQTSKAKVANDQSNVYVPISILSPSSGDNEVRQGNQASNRADSVVVNGTDQGLDQSQTGTATTTDDSRDSGWNGGGWMGGGIPLLTGTDDGSGNEAGVDQSQTGTVKNETDQDSKAKVDNEQDNTFIPVSLLSPTAGDSHVVQSNQASNQAGSYVVNGTDQGLEQDQTGTATTHDQSEDHSWIPRWNGGADRNGFQGTDDSAGNDAAVDQSQTGTVKNETDQDSKATVDNEQDNTAIPVSLLSPTAGDDHVVQSNQAANKADSVVLNGTTQHLDQNQTGTATATDSHTNGWPTWDHDEDGSGWNHDWDNHDWDQWNHHGDEWDHSDC